MIITFSHQKGGVGKSTLAFNLAQNISNSASVCIVDYDLQGSMMQISEMVDFDILERMPIKEIEKLNYDFIIVDTPPYLSEGLTDLFKISDLIIVPTRAGILDYFAIGGTINLIKEVKQEDKAIIVFNLIKSNTTITDDIINEMKSFDIKIADTHISDLVAFTRSILMKGVEFDKNAQGQIDALTEEIFKYII